MKLSEEMAVRLHRMMWSDMQRELGDCPSGNDRLKFKHEWVKRNFPGESIDNDCWLCEYASSKASRSDCDSYCKYCPISWPDRHCNTLDFSYAKDPISEILALPARNEKIMAKDDAAETVRSYYQYREDLLSKASGLPASLAIEEHVKAIQKKAREEGYETAKEYLAECSGLSQDKLVFDHIKAIQEKAVEDYFKKTPGAKLATMDVDEAFKQYADEQKAPIFHALAEASGLSAGNESVKAHISEIRSVAKNLGRKERIEEIFKQLSVYSGISENDWAVYDHVKAIQVKAKEQMKPYRNSSMLLVDTLNKYKDKLSEQSDLDRNRPVDDHIREIVKNSMEAGAAEERDRIQEKIYEVLLS